MKKNKLKVIIKIIFSSICVYILGIIIFFNLFFIGTRINNVNVSFRTASYAIQKIKNSINNYKLTIEYKTGEKEYIKSSDIDLKINKLNKIDKLLKKQNVFLWPIKIINNKYSINCISFDKSKLDKKIKNLYAIKNKNVIMPKNAEIIKRNKKIIIKKEKYGTAINKKKLIREIYKAIIFNNRYINLEKNNCYLAPKVVSSDKNFIKSVKIIKKISKKKLIIIVGNKKEILTGSKIIKFFYHDNKCNLNFDNNKLLEYVKSLEKKYNTKGKKRIFIGVDGRRHEVEGGTYGWKMNVQKEFIDIKNFIFSKYKKGKKHLNFLNKAKNHPDNNGADWGDTYVEVSLARQKMFLIENGKLIFSTNVVTGRIKGEKPTPTPTGVFYISEKKKDAILKGDRKPDGTLEYEILVEHWLRITTGGIGFHPATWRSSFGGNIYIYNGSHGCINMPSKDAFNFYNLCKINTPVIIYN